MRHPRWSHWRSLKSNRVPGAAHLVCKGMGSKSDFGPRRTAWCNTSTNAGGETSTTSWLGRENGQRLSDRKRGRYRREAETRNTGSTTESAGVSLCKMPLPSQSRNCAKVWTLQTCLKDLLDRSRTAVMPHQRAQPLSNSDVRTLNTDVAQRYVCRLRRHSIWQLNIHACTCSLLYSPEEAGVHPDVLRRK